MTSKPSLSADREAAPRQRSLLAGTFQTTYEDRIVPVGQHRGRRPEPELDYAAGILFFHLGKMSLNKRLRWSCIAALLSSNRRGVVSSEAVRKRLGRPACRESNCEPEWAIALYKALRAELPRPAKEPISWGSFGCERGRTHQ